MKIYVVYSNNFCSECSTDSVEAYYLVEEQAIEAVNNLILKRIDSYYKEELLIC